MDKKHEDDFLDSLRFSVICLAEEGVQKMADVIANRIVSVFSGVTDTWIEKNFEDVENGDIFRIMDGKERYTNK